MLFAAYFILLGAPPPSVLALPLTLLPLCLISLGAAYFLASLGVFFRDLRHILPPLITVVLFLSPVFYSAETLPAAFRFWLLLNPISLGVEQTRDALFWGLLPDPVEWLAYFLVSLAICSAGAYWFMRTKKAFADVI